MNIKLQRIEILVSTMNRESLDFLWDMFKHNNHTDFRILIINQTTPDKQLVSDFEHINVINCFEFGVPKSRNLAIKNASADICVMADDDIVYQPNLKTTVLDAHLKHPDAAMVSFEAVDEHRKPYTDYGPEGRHSKTTLQKIYTWVISFKREVYHHHHMYYNTHFGFGATFKGGEEYVFLRNAFDKGLPMVHVSQSIVQHPNESSGRLMGSDDAVFSKAALQQRFHGNLSYFWLPKYIFFIWRHNYIVTNEVFNKFQIGLKGIQAYKRLKQTGEIDHIQDV
ncbi:GT2 family glycosyltransferase [Gelidibacter sediminis]|uniref:GT2 family glycosyltransferase n=1 Tax=Gelidibacter sediminis TaxID=1608710 RepID=A0A4R7PX45_9FLAO|nr:glycosyltransferase family A protein [Gelidibacter sediminis]TDU39515.1 GT2 family glycosyltransferase [Gelidibacter sediminis]